LQSLQLLRLGFFLGGPFDVTESFFLVVATTAAPHSWRQRPPFTGSEQNIIFCFYRLTNVEKFLSDLSSFLSSGLPQRFAFLKTKK
jgi:hypothetical protein